MSIQDKLLQGAAAADGGLTPSEHFGVVLYEGDGSSSHSINGGKFGAAAYFNGSNCNITPSGFTSDQLGPNGEMSISWWMNTPINDTTVAFICEGDTDSEYMVHLGGSNTRGMRIAFAAATTNVLDVNNAFTANTWQHFVAIMTPTGNKLYRDGSLVGSNTFTETRTDFSTFYIGSRRNSSLRFEGKLDQVRIFSKELSSSEVSTLYAETASTVESLDPLSEDTTDTLQVLGDTSCIATYRFENNEDDESGNYDGTGTEIQYAAGRYGQAASFNGSASYIDPNGDWGVNGDSSHSVSFWVNFNSSSGPQHFYGIGDVVTAFTHTSLYIDSGLNTVVHDNNGNADNLATSLGLSTGQWYHFVLTYNSSDDGLEFYLNGVSKGTATRTLNVTGDAVIGRRPYYATNYLNADLDQFRVFNKALSASEVTTLYEENSLVASYRFEGNANDDTRNYDGTASNVTYEYGLNFTPDFVWFKSRNQANSPRIIDSTRANGCFIYPDGTGANDCNSSHAVIETGGFNVKGNPNTSGRTYVAWCLKANGGTTSSNTDGTITSTVQANQDAGFSIVTYTGTGSVATVGHGLGVQPYMVITKGTDSVVGNTNWKVYHNSLGGTKSLKLNSNDAATTSSTQWNDTDATSSVFSLGTSGDMNGNGAAYIAYCFAEVDGFSKFGSYTGNGSNDGTFVEIGFEPAFVMVKDITQSADWNIFDNKRDTYNSPPMIKTVLKANTSAAEADQTGIKFYSNGFSVHSSSNNVNYNGDTYIYIAFAADPDTEAPAVAKSFSTVTYTGNGGTQSIDGLGFSPNFVWLKERGQAANHRFIDTIRGATKAISSSLTNAEFTDSTGLTSFDTDGFTLGNNVDYNNNGGTFVAWAFKADDNEPTIFGGAARAVYKFEDNANDVTGNNNGTAYNVTYSSSGKFNKAAEFNGTNAYIDTGITNTVGQRSMSLWFYYTGAPSATQAMIGGVSSGSAGYTIRLETTKLKFQNQGETGPETALSNLNTNAWNHVVGVIDGSTSRLYLNGELKDTGGAADAGFHSIFIGARNDIGSADQHFDGKIDQVRIYDGVLSDIGVAALYAETASDNDNTLLGGPPETIISANANAGFSIVKYEGDGTSGARVSHGLSSTPEMIIVKELDGTSSWQVHHTGLSTNNVLLLNSTDAEANPSSDFNNGGLGTVNSTTFGFVSGLTDTNNVNESGLGYIAYCFHSVSGYSKFGSYTGTGSSGNSVNVGFAPDWVLIKGASAGSAWILHDTVRSDGTAHLRPNTNGAEDTGSNEQINFTSTGFSIRNSGATQINTSGHTYIYMAFKIN